MSAIFWTNARVCANLSLPSACLRQDDHKLTLDELNRKYGTDLNNVSVTTFTF